ncbi:hypothetical protein DFH08DRAFT_1039743 [Mycena albidolilacea]|uniref:Uncharacterized protein n=1 Tax=Mycena albidolilacea TaxID=1033008 RepID=A0AAD7EE23_9AGAR|nr:hypothetical protein DFH08DRAFT_1039743 [Mycena albidolilacea]
MKREVHSVPPPDLPDSRSPGAPGSHHLDLRGDSTTSNSQYHNAKKDTAQGRSKGLYAPAPCTPIKPPLALPNPYPLPSAPPHAPAPARTGTEIEIDTGGPPPLPFRSHISLSLTLLPFRSRPPTFTPFPFIPSARPFALPAPAPLIAGHAIPPMPPPLLALGGVDPGLPSPLPPLMCSSRSSRSSCSLPSPSDDAHKMSPAPLASEWGTSAPAHPYNPPHPKLAMGPSGATSSACARHSAHWRHPSCSRAVKFHCPPSRDR